MDRYYAHSLEGRSDDEWEPLLNHLNNVAERAARFAHEFKAAEWGRLAGLWHDLGKFSAEFQHYLRSANGLEAHLESHPGKVDHSTAGAQHAASRSRGMAGSLLAYCIAGHHGGMPDNVDERGGESGLIDRLAKSICDYSAASRELLDLPSPRKPSLDWDRTLQGLAAFQVSVFCRMLFSCLVDADFLATEAFMRSDRASQRPRTLPTPADLLPHLESHLEQLQAKSNDTPVNRARASVLQWCREQAEMPAGLFSLTVPTGGGKTLSSLAFALRHAVCHGLRRVIYAIPFTSIIEQNADVFREALARADPNGVLEHHSNLDPDEETRWGRLSAENWDAPLVVTTNVQFFESLFSNKPSRCRKLHRIVRSVIVLDECQTLPVTLLAPTLRMLDELCRNYGCTVVLCSATQPAVQQRDDFRIGLAGVREIAPDPKRLYESLRRVNVSQLGTLDDGAVVERICRHEQVLCIVNTRAHAAGLFAALRESPDSDGVYHLSAQMCAAHRTDVLNQIRERLDPDNPLSCRVVSTQLIEAGVDIDFPTVYRAMAGLDSIAQAAGRCNREGRMECGQVFVFDTAVNPPGDLRLRRQLGAEVAGLHDDLLSLDAIEHFFRLCYWTRESEWDKEGVLGCFSLSTGRPHFQLREAAQKYKLIRDDQLPVIVPYGERGRELVGQLRRMPEPPGRVFDRSLQRYIVGLYERQFSQLRENQSIAQYHDRFWILENDSAYDDLVGLRIDLPGLDPERLII